MWAKEGAQGCGLRGRECTYNIESKTFLPHGVAGSPLDGDGDSDVSTTDAAAVEAAEVEAAEVEAAEEEEEEDGGGGADAEDGRGACAVHGRLRGGQGSASCRAWVGCTLARVGLRLQ